MLSIDTADFQLQMRPVATQREEPGGPYLEWLDVWIKIEVPGIQAEGAWSVMPGELRGFLQQIQSMHAQLRPGQHAELAGVEAGFNLRVQVLDRGAIIGDWRFQPSPRMEHALRAIVAWTSLTCRDGCKESSLFWQTSHRTIRHS